VFESSITITLTPARFAVSLTTFTPANVLCPLIPTVSSRSWAWPDSTWYSFCTLYNKIQSNKAFVRRISEALIRIASRTISTHGTFPYGCSTGRARTQSSIIRNPLGAPRIRKVQVHRDILPTLPGRTPSSEAPPLRHRRAAYQAHPGLEIFAFPSSSWGWVTMNGPASYLKRQPPASPPPVLRCPCPHYLPPIVACVFRSRSDGGAGVQADLLTLPRWLSPALRNYGITVQDTAGVENLQRRSGVGGGPGAPRARGYAGPRVQVGMVGSIENIAAIAEVVVRLYPDVPLVFDPVLLRARPTNLRPRT